MENLNNAVYFLIALLLSTGFLILMIDVAAYRRTGMKKEQGYSKGLGWFNMTTGSAVLIINWIYQTWFW